MSFYGRDDSGRVSHKLSAQDVSRKWRFQGEIIRFSSCRLHSLVMCDNFTQWLMHTNNLAPAARFLKSSQAAPLTPLHCGLRIALRGIVVCAVPTALEHIWAREEGTNLRNFAGDQRSTFGRHWALEWGMLCELLRPP